ncbi:hypothetical protein RND81_02G186800 [Saponaria officinalis]|uniref:Uncharacterized protein n=1 Tax=Saponaria officinalis TaxID=3572 RepID=A0AAW1MN51_SAPOF
MKTYKVKKNIFFYFFNSYITLSFNLPLYCFNINLQNQMSMSTRYCCMLMRITVDCKGCCKKLRRTLLNMKEVETHVIERQLSRVSVCGRFRPSDVAIKIRRRINRRVEILDIQEFDGGGGGDGGGGVVFEHTNDHHQQPYENGHVHTA